MKCILHIGTEKTGTTSLQSFFNINRDLLISNQIYYLKSPGLTNHRIVPVLFYPDDYIDDFRIIYDLKDESVFNTWKEKNLNFLNKELNNIPSNINTVIISSEHFHSRLIYESSIYKLSNYLKKYFNQIEVVLYLRRQDRVAVSLYSTAIKLGHFNYNIFPKIENTNTYYNYHSLVTKWGSVFGKENLKIRLYDYIIINQKNIIYDFLKCFNLIIKPEPNFPTKLNTKLPIETLKIIEKLNKYFPRFSEYGYSEFNNKFRLSLIQEFLNLNGSPFTNVYLPNKRKAKEFYNIFKASNISLNNYWFGKEEDIFDNDFSDYPNEELEDYNFTIGHFEKTFKVVSAYIDQYKLNTQ